MHLPLPAFIRWTYPGVLWIEAEAGEAARTRLPIAIAAAHRE
jgi:hypothetical protein